MGTAKSCPSLWRTHPSLWTQIKPPARVARRADLFPRARRARPGLPGLRDLPPGEPQKIDAEGRSEPPALFLGKGAPCFVFFVCVCVCFIGRPRGRHINHFFGGVFCILKVTRRLMSSVARLFLFLLLIGKAKQKPTVVWDLPSPPPPPDFQKAQLVETL